MPKALDKSINKARAKPCLSRQNFRPSVSANKACCVQNSFLYPHKSRKRHFPMQLKICFCIIRSNILETVGGTLTGL